MHADFDQLVSPLDPAALVVTAATADDHVALRVGALDIEPGHPAPPE